MKKIEVVAAIIYFENKILCVKRPKNKLSYISEKFEFPGGKIEQGKQAWVDEGFCAVERDSKWINAKRCRYL